MTTSNPKTERTRKVKPLYVVMFDGSDGPLYSFDTGNPFMHLRTARRALAKQGKEKASLYYIVKFVPERRI
jgi:hypothetical protein